MRAVVFAGPGSVRIDEVPEPTIRDPSDVIVGVARASICGSDLHLLDGKTPGGREGGVIGHEYVGTVTAAGDEVSDLVGRRVLGSFLIVCGTCRHCAARRFNFCERRRALGLGTLTGDLDGSQAEYVRVPDARINVRRVPDDVDDEAVLFAGDILTTGFYAAATSDISEGDLVVVIGAGPVGLFCAAAAARFRPEKVIVLDLEPSRVEFARAMGLEAIDVSELDPQAAVAGATGGRMADVAMDAVGAVPAVKTGMKCVRDGGRVTVVGVYGAERYELPMGVAWIRGIDLRFTGMANIQGHWDDALDAIRDGTVDGTRAITHRLPLDDAEEGYELFRSRAAVKVVLVP